MFDSYTLTNIEPEGDKRKRISSSKRSSIIPVAGSTLWYSDHFTVISTFNYHFQNKYLDFLRKKLISTILYE